MVKFGHNIFFANLLLNAKGVLFTYLLFTIKILSKKLVRPNNSFLIINLNSALNFKQNNLILLFNIIFWLIIIKALVLLMEIIKIFLNKSINFASVQ